VAANVPLPDPHWHGEDAKFSKTAIVIVTCPFCREEFKACAFVNPSMCSLEFIDHPLTPISASPPMVVDDDWYSDVPEDPYAIFNASIAEARFLLDEKGGDGSSLVNRMVFTHYIGAFEAFLADTLINYVFSDGTALKRLIERDHNLRERQFSLLEIASAPELIKETVHARLRSEMWHNINKVNSLYMISFGIDIRAMLAENNEKVDEAVRLRHDCVHRNGRDKDGVELSVFTKEYVIGVGVILSQLAHNIIKAFRERDAAAFFVGSASSIE
jgi:hypothetical protein